VAGIAAAIVVIIIVVVAAILVLRNKQENTSVTPSAIIPANVKSGAAPKTSKPSFTDVKAVRAKPEPEPHFDEVPVAPVVTEQETDDNQDAVVSLHDFVGSDGSETLTLGQRVMAHGYQTGVIKYIGELKSMPSMNGVTYIGIKLDKPEGSGDGTVNGIRYFDCDPFCSVFVTPHTVKAI